MPECFGRKAIATVGGVEMVLLRFQFRIEKTNTPEPNTIDLSISNLSKATRDKLSEKTKNAGAPVLFEAGYEGETCQLFKGDCRYIAHRHDGTDYVTRVQSGDGDVAFKSTRVHESFGPGVDVRQVAKSTMEAMKLEMRDAIANVQNGDWKGAQETFWHGATASGRASQVLTDLLDSGGYTWSIQDGVLQALGKGQTSAGDAVLLSASTGLVGVPEQGEKGYLKLRSLLNGKIKPGCRLTVDTSPFRGAFRCEKVVHSGDSEGAEWYSDVEAWPL